MPIPRGLLSLLPAVALAVLAAVCPARAQEAADASALADIHRQIEQSNDPEQTIALGEKALAIEPGVASWTLTTPRDAFKSSLHAALGQAYVNRAQGVRADNIEKAVLHFEAVLALVSREAAPIEWAGAHNDAGVAYWNRVRGERADNQERALSHFESALEVFTRERHPQDWASLNSNLASLYLVRMRGNRADNFEAAIAHLETAQTVLTREAAPQPWAMVQSNLGNAYRVRVKGDAAENIETSLAKFDSALQVFTRDAAPFQWAQIQLSQAVTFQTRKRGTVPENLKRAIAHLEAAQSVFTRDAFPLQWAGTKAAIGDIYANMASGDRAGHRKRAIAAYRDALTIQTRDGAPLAHLEISKALGATLADAGDCKSATAVYASAREAFLMLFGEGLEDADTRALVTTAGPMFADAAYCVAETGEATAAVQLASEGRARLLGLSLKLQGLAFDPEQRRQLDELRGEVRIRQSAVDDAQGADRDAALRQLAAARAELLALIESAEPDGALSVLASDQASEAVDADGVLLLPVVTARGTKMLVFDGARKSWSVVALPDLTIGRITDLLASTQSRDNPGWIEAYFANYFQDEVEQKRRWPQWLAAVDGIGVELWNLFGISLAKEFARLGVKPGRRLILMPAGRLGVFPLSLAQNPKTKRRLIDDFEIVTTPSLEALAIAHRQAGESGPRTLAVVINPTGDLPGTEKEGAIVASHFSEDERAVLAGDAASADAVLAALRGRRYWHFASHGTFNWQDVRSSGLIMRGGERLSVSRLSEASDLGRPRLVVLSACETGLSDIVTANPDEFIGLPNAFAALGAVGIVGTLWPVSDAATALLVAKFYDLHLDEGLSPPNALRRAQLWLRDASKETIEDYAQQSSTRGRLDSRHLSEIKQDLDPKARASRNAGAAPQITDERSRGPRPYAHPYYWGGFVYTGL